MNLLVKHAKNSGSILDMGCGEGTRLSFIPGSPDKKLGVDISKVAIKMAKKKYQKISFICADLEKLPFPDEKFDLVYSFYVLEHLSSPQEVLNEAKRVLRKDGALILVAPNYGAPNRASPPNKSSRISKLFAGLLEDYLTLFSKRSSLSWHKVKPLANESEYEIDWDATVEPYLHSLVEYLKYKDFKITYHTSSWQTDTNLNFHQSIFQKLANLHIFPFNYWGPVIVISAVK